MFWGPQTLFMAEQAAAGDFLLKHNTPLLKQYLFYQKLKILVDICQYRGSSNKFGELFKQVSFVAKYVFVVCHLFGRFCILGWLRTELTLPKTNVLLLILRFVGVFLYLGKCVLDICIRMRNGGV